MGQDRRGRNLKTLWVLVLLGIAYSSLLYCEPTLTGAKNLDGIIGVLLGLYICSHPAANVVDLLFLGQDVQRPLLSKRAVVLWLALNMLGILTGGIVIFAGTTRFISR